MSNNKKLTPMRYYDYRIINYKNECNQFFRGGGLFQQYSVDIAAKIEGHRLRYIRLNQTSLRSTTYKGLTDLLNDDDVCSIGTRIILFSTFVGGTRYIMERFQDAMMYIRKCGNALFFITMACDPNWPESRQNLFLNQKPHDRPDLIARVFDLKRKLYIKYIPGVDGLLGKCIAYVITVEYQNRGHLYVQCLLWFNETSKPRPEEYDKFIQVEISDPNKHPESYQLVLKHMIHSPNCSNNSPC
ncbi:uncharacterized protein LOC106874931 [Octopus bimaculoides]|uniref:uncharacterized protein LOC106874931 n=1 Tax=Octopus bimaculoides TaxID=37653 RepID=UPI00071C8EF7|nr:uncharacterized protein LOC106874931 [Octopus bimaculoides]|eukprot:XP_014778333.1 PREDICTED: uncharacterized protein LOC106874931 [Octopus bimaculoides]